MQKNISQTLIAAVQLSTLLFTTHLLADESRKPSMLNTPSTPCKKTSCSFMKKTQLRFNGTVGFFLP